MVGQFHAAMHSFQRDVADRRSNGDAAALSASADDKSPVLPECSSSAASSLPCPERTHDSSTQRPLKSVFWQAKWRYLATKISRPKCRKRGEKASPKSIGPNTEGRPQILAPPERVTTEAVPGCWPPFPGSG